MNSRQRAYLGSLANNIDPIFQIGKASLTPEIIEALDAALEKRELIKVSVLKNCIDDPKEIASVIAERTHSNVVKVIGKKMIFYRKAKKNPKILIQFITDIFIWQNVHTNLMHWIRYGLFPPDTLQIRMSMG